VAIKDWFGFFAARETKRERGYRNYFKNVGFRKIKLLECQGEELTRSSRGKLIKILRWGRLWVFAMDRWWCERWSLDFAHVREVSLEEGRGKRWERRSSGFFLNGTGSGGKAVVSGGRGLGVRRVRVIEEKLEDASQETLSNRLISG